MQSTTQARGEVSFPAFTGERIYMLPFTKNNPLPPAATRWQATVDAMLQDVDARGPVYLMVDQAEVEALASHRRSGVHVDGYWHGTDHSHSPRPGHRAHGFDVEGIILASDVFGCVAYEGEYQPPSRWGGGDCSDVDTAALKRIEFEPSRAYAGDARWMLHESVPLRSTARRTLVRLNVPGWLPS